MASYKICTCGSCKRNNYRKYRVRWRDKAGKQRQKHVDNVKQSKQLIAQIERDLQLGVLADPSLANITFGEYYKGVPYLGRGNETTQSSLQGAFELHILPYFSGYKLRDITRQDVQKWVDMMLDKGYTKSTLEKYTRMIKIILQYAHADNHIDRNPSQLIVIKGEQREREPKPLTPDQLIQFIDLWDEDKLLSEHANYVTALAFTGMRPSEATALRWDNVDLENSEIRIRECFRRKPNGEQYLSDTLKSKQAKRTLAIPSYLVGRLRFRRDKHPHEEFVFSSVQGKPIILSNFRKRYWQRAILKTSADLDIAVPYDLRHTFSALMHSTGISIWELSQMLGHSDTKTTQQWYGTWYEQANHSAVEVIDDWKIQGTKSFKLVD